MLPAVADPGGGAMPPPTRPLDPMLSGQMEYFGGNVGLFASRSLESCKKADEGYGGKTAG